MNTLLYISTILAYVFMLLAASLLILIVIYVFHNVYAIVYDNVLPAPKQDFFQESGMTRYRRRYRRSALPALRIWVTQESCYLAYVTFATKTNRARRNITVYFDRLTEIPIVGECTSELQFETEKPVSLHAVIDTVGQNAKKRRTMGLSISSSTLEKPSIISHLIKANSRIAAQTEDFPASSGEQQRADEDELD